MTQMCSEQMLLEKCTDRFAQCRATTNLQFVKKHNKCKKKDITKKKSEAVEELLKLNY
mgnify:CR=1 FL=1